MAVHRLRLPAASSGFFLHTRWHVWALWCRIVIDPSSQLWESMDKPMEHEFLLWPHVPAPAAMSVRLTLIAA
eukprot:scaffold265733_cov14-Tisochrysis_lutea.AAC.1